MSEKIPKLGQDLIAGTVGGWAQVIVGQPLDTIKVRLQTQPSPAMYKNATDCFRQLVQQEGVRFFLHTKEKGLKRELVKRFISWCDASFGGYWILVSLKRDWVFLWLLIYNPRKVMQSCSHPMAISDGCYNTMERLYQFVKKKNCDDTIWY